MTLSEDVAMEAVRILVSPIFHSITTLLNYTRTRHICQQYHDGMPSSPKNDKIRLITSIAK